MRLTLDYMELALVIFDYKLLINYNHKLFSHVNKFFNYT